MNTPKKQEPPIAIRLPAETKEFIKAAAKANFRSISAEIAHRVERSRLLEQDQQATGAAQ